MRVAQESLLEHTAGPEQLLAREELAELYMASPLPVDDELFNLGLYCRSGLLVKFLVMADLYKRFVNVPGIMVEFGVWHGQNAVLLENLRAIYEPFNRRRYVGFDTWAGYPDMPHWYNAGDAGLEHLKALLDVHSRCNVYGHIPSGHELVRGNVIETAPAWFHANQDALVAFAYVDMGPYEPTLAALRAILPRMVPGSVVLLDELQVPGGKGEAQAFRDAFGQQGYRLEVCPLYRSKAIVTIC